MTVGQHDTFPSHKDTWTLMLLESLIVSVDVDFVFKKSAILVFRRLESQNCKSEVRSEKVLMSGSRSVTRLDGFSTD